jgi:hypothetical protein
MVKRIKEELDDRVGLSVYIDVYQRDYLIHPAPTGGMITFEIRVGNWKSEQVISEYELDRSMHGGVLLLPPPHCRPDHGRPHQNWCFASIEKVPPRRTTIPSGNPRSFRGASNSQPGGAKPLIWLRIISDFPIAESPTVRIMKGLWRRSPPPTSRGFPHDVCLLAHDTDHNLCPWRGSPPYGAEVDGFPLIATQKIRDPAETRVSKSLKYKERTQTR